MSYTINPNAKNKWVRNAENTMDLSLETDASSVYLDNGRTLEQELGEGSMVSNVVTVDNAMSKVIDGTLDGAYESLVFKGKSLVNLANKSQENAHYTDYNLSYIDKTKTYFIKVISTKAIVKIGFIVNNTTWNNTVDCEQITNGYVIIKPNETLEVGGLRVITSDSTTSYTLKTMIIEYQQGMENWDIPYFEGICDVKMPILRNVGKNLANQSKYEIEAYVGGNDGATVAIGSAAKNTQSIIMEIEPNVSIVASSSSNSDRKVLACFNHFPTNGSKATKKTNSGYITTDTDTKYVMYYYNSDTVANGIVSQVQIEESPSPTQYEPYKTNILHTPETVTLRSLPNGVRDELNLKTGEYIQRIGEIVLDGTQDMSSDSNGVFIQVNDVKRFLNYTGKMACDKLPIMPTYGHLANVENGVSGYTNANGYLGQNWLYIRINNSINKDEVKEWLTQNPITVQYELAEPITTIVEPLTIPFAYENGHVILESGFEGQSLLPILEYSTVVNRTGQVESVAKVIQKQEKQLTMLEQMLIQNIINLDYNNTLLTLKNEMEEML